MTNFVRRAGLLAMIICLGTVMVAVAHNPMDTNAKRNDAQSRGNSAHTKLGAVQSTYADKLTQYAALSGYDNPNWTQSTRDNYRAADTECAAITAYLNGKGFFDTGALDDADSWYQSGLDYMSFGQWDNAYAAFEVCIGAAGATPDLDYGYDDYSYDYDTQYVSLCGWIAYMDALNP